VEVRSSNTLSGAPDGSPLSLWHAKTKEYKDQEIIMNIGDVQIIIKKRAEGGMSSNFLARETRL
jgi:hypothetical protein